MEGYLGTVDVSDEFDIGPIEGALMYIQLYGGIDGAHHKDWLLDQIARILNGAPIKVEHASWDNGHTELRYDVGESEEYHAWVKEISEDPDGGEGWDYDLGIAP